MASKFLITIALFIAAASAGVIPADVYHSAPAVATYTAPASIFKVPQPVLAKADDEYDPHPQYKFSYDVQDAVSGDSKSQFEERDGDVVRGEYALIDSDGYKRTVQYTSDPHNGFNAVVNREPLVHAVKTVAAPLAYSAPAVAPVTHYAAPAAVVKTVAPVSHYTAPAAVVKTVSPVAHYAAPAAVVKTVSPVAHYTAPASVVKTVAPFAPAYSTYAHH